MADLDTIIAELDKLTLLEASELAKRLEEHWDVTAAAPMMAAMPMGGMPGAAAEEAVEQTEFDVVLEAAGGQKIQVIKAVREVNSGLGLKEAKEVVESAPTAILEGANKEDAQAAKERLEKAGATIVIK